VDPEQRELSLQLVGDGRLLHAWLGARRLSRPPESSDDLVGEQDGSGRIALTLGVLSLAFMPAPDEIPELIFVRVGVDHVELVVVLDLLDGVDLHELPREQWILDRLTRCLMERAVVSYQLALLRSRESPVGQLQHEEGWRLAHARERRPRPRQRKRTPV